MSYSTEPTELLTVRRLQKKAAPTCVTQAVTPDLREYFGYLSQIFRSKNLTNNGKLLMALEKKLSRFCHLDDLACCANGTLALQLCLRAAMLEKKEIITSPFSYVATVSAILAEGFTPVFADIDEETLCMSPASLQRNVSAETAAILPVHVYGNACDCSAIEQIARECSAKTIYDAAQAFGSKLHGKSLLSYGDFSAVSFHATKIFHTAEGGGVTAAQKEDLARVRLIRAFGHIADDHSVPGLNAKMSELHAALGLCLLKKTASVIAAHKKRSALYDALLPVNGLRKPGLRQGLEYNYAYYPVIFGSVKIRDRVMRRMNQQNIFPRKYFSPSLNTLPYLPRKQACPVAERISSRVLCLPLHAQLEEKVIEHIAKIIKGVM